MKIDKLRSIRDGHRKYIENQLERIERAKENSSLVEFHAILESISGKAETLNSLNEKILELTEVAEVGEEIVSSEEYALTLEIKVRELRAYSENRGGVEQNTNSRRQGIIPDHAGINTNSGDINTNSVSSANSSHFHRLPKLSLPVFDGNILQWQAFWDSFNSAVHTNQSLTDVQKFNYLRSQLEHDAARTIEGFALTNANYARAVDLLQERFGQVHKITHSYMQALLQLPSPSNTLHSLRNYYDKLENYIRGLESLGQFQESYGTLLVPVILDKLPAEIRKTLARQHRGNNISLQELRRAISEEINVMEAGQICDMNEYGTPTMSLLTGSGSRHHKNKRKENHMQVEYRNKTGAKVCAFCSSNQHFSNDCTVVKDYESRIAVVKNKRLCFNCLGTHQVSKCKSSNRCRNCKQKHHTSICQKDTSTSGDNSKYSNMNNVHREENAAILHTYNDSVSPTCTSVLNSTSVQHSSRVLLKTAVAPVSTGYSSVDANILFDEGSQRSFITSSLADELKLTRTGTDTIHLASFGSETNHIRHLETATISLVTTSGDKIPLQVLIVPMIAVPLRNYHSDVITLPYLRHLRLAHPVTDDISFEVQILIGADYYWKVVEDEIIRGSGPTAVKSKVGYLLSGPVCPDSSQSSTSNPTTSLTLNVLTQSPPDIDIEKFWKLV